MTAAVLFKLVALWLLLAVLAVLNGILREKVLIPVWGASVGLPASGIILSLAIFLVSCLALPWYGRLPSYEYWIIGLAWLVMTLVFELGLGRFAAHKSWPELFEAYTLSKGNLWLAVLAASFASPWLAAQLRGYI